MNVYVLKDKLDALANAIGIKAKKRVPQTIDELIDTVGGIQTAGLKQAKTVSITPTESAQSQTVEPDSGYDGLDEVSVSVGAISSTYVGSGITRRSSSSLSASGATVTAPSGYYASSASKSVASGQTYGTAFFNVTPDITVDSDGLITSAALLDGEQFDVVYQAGWLGVSERMIGYVSGSNTSQLSTQAETTITPTESEQTAVAAGKYTTGAVKVGAISSSYVGSGITQRSSTDLSASGNTVSVPSGYYASNASKAVASGTEGTPTATKSSVSNHSVSVTPSVTNVAGYISGGTHSGTAVTVSASELVSGNKEITENGTNIDVADYATVSVAVPTGGITQDANGYLVLSDTGGGGGGTSIVWGRLRGDATLVKSWAYDGLIVADESVTIPAYSTNDTTLKSGAALTSESLDFSSYSYMLIYRYLSAPVYSNSTISSGRQIYHAASGLYSFIFVPMSSFDYGGIEATAAAVSQQYSSVGVQMFSRGVYYNSGSSIRMASTDYGAYMSADNPSITVASSSPYDTATLSITSPNLKIRGSTAQLNSTNWGYITDIRYQYIYELYRVPASDTVHGWELESQFHHILDCVNGNGTLT